MNNPATTPTPRINHSTNFRPASLSDISLFASHLRPECEAECLAIIGTDPLTALLADRENVYVFDGKDGRPCVSITVGRAGESDCAILVAVGTNTKTNAPFLVRQLTKFCAA